MITRNVHNYKGSDLGDGYKRWYNGIKKILNSYFKEIGVEEVNWTMGFYYVSVKFLIDGQHYHLFSNDTRFCETLSWTLRICDGWLDYRGGINHHLDHIKELDEKLNRLRRQVNKNMFSWR